MNTGQRLAAITVTSAVFVLMVLITCTQLFGAGRADASGEAEELTKKIAETYNASLVKLVDNKWNNRIDVEMVVKGKGYNCLMPTPDELKKAVPLKCTTFVFLATEV